MHPFKTTPTLGLDLSVLTIRTLREIEKLKRHTHDRILENLRSLVPHDYTCYLKLFPNKQTQCSFDQLLVQQFLHDAQHVTQPSSQALIVPTGYCFLISDLRILHENHPDYLDLTVRDVSEIARILSLTAHINEHHAQEFFSVAITTTWNELL